MHVSLSLSLSLSLSYIYIHCGINVKFNFRVSITPEDPRWVGAWWVGFLIASALFLVAAIPISAYGAELPSEY